MYMKKQFQLLMYTGIMAAAVMASCKTADSVVLYDADARPNKVYRATNTAGAGTNTEYTRSVQKNGADYIISNTNAVTSNYQEQTAPSCPYSNAPSGQYMPQVVDMTTQNNVQTGYYNQQVQPVSQNYGAYNSVQVYNTRANNAYQSTTGRNKALDNNLYNRPTAYTLSEDMYTPEYRTMVNTRQNRGNNVQLAQNDPYTGLMTLENGNVVPYNTQPQIVAQQQYYAQPEYVQPQQYVVPTEPRRQCCVESQNEVRQADGSYPATLFFKNGAKLTGTLVKIDNTACMFKMAEGRLVNFATKDILKIERRR